MTDPPDRASPDRVGTPALAEVGQPEAAVLETVDASGAGAAWRSDNPLSNPADDLLGRAPFAKGVAAAIRGRQDPSSIVVGLYGPWGDGKSTVLNFVEAALNGSDVVVVPFNPWLISDERELLPAFFTEVARELDVRLGGTKRRVGDALRKVGGFLSPLSVSTQVAGASPGSLVGYLADQVAGTSLVALRQDFEKALEEAGKRVVVTVDDLDRLDDREIRSMFRLIRLAAPFDRLTYVVACDETVVANALSQMQGSTATTGLAYLEKIVQVPLHIPPAPEPALTRMALDGLQSILDATGITYTDAEAHEIGTRYRSGLAPALRTPRSIKRLLNALAFALPLLKGEANLADVIAVEGIHVAHPTVYRALRENRDWFLSPQPRFGLGRDDVAEKKVARERIETCLPATSPDREAALSVLRRLFPPVDSLWSTMGSRDASELYAEQRMASPAYYERYLSYALPVDEISDQEIDALLADPPRLGAGILDMLKIRGRSCVGSLTSKIEARIEQLPPEIVEGLLGLLPFLGASVIDSNAAPSGLFGWSLQERLANVIARLVARLTGRHRVDAAERVLATAAPLTFALECLRGFHRRESDTQGPPFDERTLDRLEQALGRRVIAALDAKEPIWAREPRWATLLYVASKDRKGAKIRRLVRNWLQSPGSVETLLAGLAGMARNLGTGDVIQQDFTTQTYESLRQVADLRDVRRAISKRYGKVKVESYPPDASYVRDGTRAVVEQFVFLDAKQRAAGATPTAPGEPADEAE